MNFQDAEKTYRDLKQQYDAGKLTEEDLEAQVAKLLLQDAQGHWWQIGVESGEWYMHDGQQWNKAKPPTAPAAPVAPPAPVAPAVPPAPVVPAAPPSVPPTPAAQKDTRDSVLPAQRKRSASARRGNGISSSMLIGIVAVVAILCVVGGCIVLSGMLGGSLTARATTTPTRSLVLLPTVTLVALDTPLPPPTIEVTPTETPTLAKPTATRRLPTPTPAGPTATATLNVPPGVYVTNIETIPAQANIGDTIGFKVSFLNTTGSIQTYNWFVKVYECPVQCEDFKHSHGDTLTMNSNLAPGTSALSTSQTIDLKAGISCGLIAIANYVDPVNQLPTPFQATKNDGHFSFTPCH